MRLDVLTPRGTLVTAEVNEVIAPGVMGEFGVLPGHIPFLTGIRAGVLRWSGAAGDGRVAVGAGFAEVNNDRVSVLLDMGVRADAVDVAAVRAELASAEEALAAAETGGESVDRDALALATSKRDWAQARLDTVGAPPKA